MSSVHVDYAALEAAAQDLTAAGADLDASGGSAPSGVDAGDATYIVTGLISQVVSSAAGLSEGLQAAAEKIRGDMTSYRSVDDNARHGLTYPGGPR